MTRLVNTARQRAKSQLWREKMAQGGDEEEEKESSFSRRREAQARWEQTLLAEGRN